MIELKNVTKYYGQPAQRFEVLKGIDLTIPTGVSVAIIGKSGSGKSTLMHVMSGLDRPQTGEVIVDGQDLLNLRPKTIDRFRSQKIGFIFQAFFVQGNESCFYNVSLPLEIARIPRNKRNKLIARALESVQMSEKSEERAKNLSGGQKQRLAIARAIVTEPKIIFADEPTGNLDTTTGESIENLLFELNKSQGVTLVIVTHDHDLAARCDMRVHLKDGEITKVERNNKPKSKGAVR